MKFKIDRKEFLFGLQVVQHVLSKDFPNVKIDVTESDIKLTTNNGESMIVYNVPREVDEQQTFIIESIGSMVLPCKKLIGLLKKIKDGIIVIEHFENKTTISNGLRTSRVVFDNAETFLNEELIEKAPSLHVDADEMEEALSSIINCVSKKDIRPVLTTINMKYDTNELKFIATDSYRLGQFICDNYGKDFIRDCEPFDLGINLKPLYNILKQLNLPISITINNNTVLFVLGDEFDNVKYQVKALNWTFPDTREFIPKTFGIEVYVNLQEFKESLKRLKNFVNENKVVKLKINSGVSLSVETEEFKAEEFLIESKVHGGDLTIACNIDFLLDALKTLKTETICIGFNGDLYPFVLTNMVKLDDRNTQLIVPIRVE